MYYGCVVFENYTDENSYELHHDGERGEKNPLFPRAKNIEF